MKTLLAIALLSGALLALPAHAQNMSFLKNSVVSKFNPEDMKLLQVAAKKALADPQDGTAYDWKNEKTSASGSISSVKSYSKAGAACRDIRFTNHYKANTDEAVKQFCKNAAGAWKLAA